MPLFLGLFWLLAIYTQVQASFLSAFLGQDALAQIDGIPSNISIQQNSQTLDLLQANVSSASVLFNQNDKKDDKKDQIDPTTNLNIISDNAILPATGPMGVSDGKDSIDPSSLETSVYVVRKGDTISQIATMFDVSVNTILWANDMKKGDKLNEEDVLFILPVSGLEHIATKGQTLQSIAKMYKADVDDIANFNDLISDSKLAVGDKLIIPDGEMNDEGGDKPASNLKATETKDKNYYASSLLKNIVGYFINPLPTGRKTQGLHGPGKRGIDIGAPKGTPIYASASGTVLIAKTGWSGGYGNMAIIQHPNGTKTLYGHMNKLGTKTGAMVSQGEIIGYVGSTGRSTGPHLHFEVFNVRNPGADWSWAK